MTVVPVTPAILTGSNGIHVRSGLLHSVHGKWHKAFRGLRRSIKWFVIWFVRFVIDVLAYRLQRVFEVLLRCTCRRHFTVRHYHYGPGWREVCDVITPTHVEEYRKKPVVVYVHGGGWMIVSKDLMRPYVTYMARKGGFRVVNADYPLSPETRFPAALISMLRLLSWIKQDLQADRVILMGDSAGAALSVLTSLLLLHPQFLKELSLVSGLSEITKWSYPSVERLCLFYGLFCEESLSAKTLATVTCREVVRMHRNRDIFGGKCLPLDFSHYIDHSFPKTCIMTGTCDPLYPGNVRFYEVLKSKGGQVSLQVFDGQVHGFHSFFWSFRRYHLQDCVIQFLLS